MCYIIITHFVKQYYLYTALTTNGFITKDGITINLNSPKALQTIVGHEISHVLEGTELYGSLQSELKSYLGDAEYNKRLAAIKETYKDIYKGEDAETKFEQELTADLVGDLLFTDKNFVSRLYSGNRNLFQKIFDEVKYLCRVATAGSKQARQLEKIKHTFEEVYKEGAKAQKNTAQEDGVRYSLVGRTADGTGIYKTNYPKNTPKAVKQADLISLVQNVWSNNPIILDIVQDGKTKKIEAKFNPDLSERSDLSKIAFGNRKGNASDQRMTLDLSSDLYQIAADSKYLYSKEAMPKPNNPAHDGVTQYHYFLTNLVYQDNDNNYIPCHMNIDVKQNSDGNWFYSFGIEKGSAPQTLLAAVTENSATLPTDSISNSNEKVNKKLSLSSETDNITPVEEGAKVQKNTAQEDGEVRWSISSNLSSDIDSVLDGTFDASKNEVYLGETSNFLTDVIGAKSLSLYMPASKVYSSILTEEEYNKAPHYVKQDNYHGIGKEDFMDILEKSETPIAAFASRSDEKGNKRQNRIVLVTDKLLTDKQTGKTGYAVVVEEVDSTALSKGKRIKANKTITVYPRTQLNSDITEAMADGRILDITKKGEQLLAGVRGSNPQAAIQETILKKNIANFWANVKWGKEKNKTVSSAGSSGFSTMKDALQKAGYIDQNGHIQNMQKNRRNSLSAENENTAPVKDGIYGKDVLLDDLPIRQTVSKTETVDDAVGDIPIRSDIKPNKNEAESANGIDDLPIADKYVSTRDKYERKLNSYRTSISANERNKANSYESFNEAIEKSNLKSPAVFGRRFFNLLNTNPWCKPCP